MIQCTCPTFSTGPTNFGRIQNLNIMTKNSDPLKEQNKLIRHTSLKISSEFKTQCCDCGTCVLIYLLWSIGPSLIWYVIRVGTLIIMYFYNINNTKKILCSKHDSWNLSWKLVMKKVLTDVSISSRFMLSRSSSRSSSSSSWAEVGAGADTGVVSFGGWTADNWSVGALVGIRISPADVNLESWSAECGILNRWSPWPWSVNFISTIRLFLCLLCYF